MRPTPAASLPGFALMALISCNKPVPCTPEDRSFIDATLERVAQDESFIQAHMDRYWANASATVKEVITVLQDTPIECGILSKDGAVAKANLLEDSITINLEHPAYISNRDTFTAYGHYLALSPQELHDHCSNDHWEYCLDPLNACSSLAFLAKVELHEGAHVALNRWHRLGADGEARDIGTRASEEVDELYSGSDTQDAVTLYEEVDDILKAADDEAAMIDEIYGFGVSGKLGVIDSCNVLADIILDPQ